MSQAEVIKLLQQCQPKTAQEILDKCELPLQFIGDGQFRKVYHVIGTELVIKIPLTQSRHNRQHAADEYVIWKRIRKSRRKFKQLKPYLPDLVYYNSDTGIIVMPRYGKVRWPKGRGRHAVMSYLEGLFTSTLDIKEADIKEDNLGSDKYGKIKVFDLGLFIAGEV